VACIPLAGSNVLPPKVTSAQQRHLTTSFTLFACCREAAAAAAPPVPDAAAGKSSGKDSSKDSKQTPASKPAAAATDAAPAKDSSSATAASGAAAAPKAAAGSGGLTLEPAATAADIPTPEYGTVAWVLNSALLLIGSRAFSNSELKKSMLQSIIIIITANGAKYNEPVLFMRIMVSTLRCVDVLSESEWIKCFQLQPPR
jgi:hypothetical protein